MRFAVAVGLVLAVVAAGASSAAREQATLRIVRLAPLTVRGAGFDANERVQVVATTGRGRSRIAVKSGAGGGFTARFSPFLAVEPCHGALVVTATAADGTRATVKRPCRPGDPQTP